MHHDKENKKIDKEYEGSIKETPKLKIECEDFEEFLFQQGKGLAFFDVWVACKIYP